MRNLESVDLNLLVTLEALLSERNVTRAARRLHLSQPSVSVRLGRLRRLFADPLLLPGPRGMLPTARATEMLEPLRAALAGVEAFLAPAAPFVPAQADFAWPIACADYSEYAVLLPFVAQLQRRAPGIRVAVHHVAPAQLARLAESGGIDAALIDTASAPPSLHRQALFQERYLVAGRSRHPALRGRLSLERFCQLRHVLVSPEGGGFFGLTDAALQAAGRSRRVVLSAASFLYIPDLLRGSDLVAVLPERLLRGRNEGLRVLEPPLAIPGFEVSLVWHERVHRAPAQRWLREQMAAVAADVPNI